MPKFLISNFKFQISLIILSVFIIQSSFGQTVTAKQYKHLPWIAVTFAGTLVTQNQWRWYDKNHSEFYDSRYYECYEEYQENLNNLEERYKEGLIDKDWYDNTLKEYEFRYGYLDEMKNITDRRCNQYLWYFGISAGVAIGSLVYALIPVKVELPVDMYSTANSIHLVYNF
jgi:hypothetical protein